MIEICNLRNEKPVNPYDIYVDRRSVLGNPYPDRDGKSRDLVCDRYEDHFTYKSRTDNRFQRELGRLLAIYEYHGKLRLFCWCAPKRCHAETIKRWLERHIQ